MDQPQAKTPLRRRLPLAVWIGCALLAGSLAGASWNVSNGSGPTRTSAETPVSAPPMKKTVSHGHVDVESGVVQLYPLQPGRVKKVFVKDNDEVPVGTPLFEMDDTVARAMVAEAKADLAAAEIRLKLARQLPEQQQAKLDAQKAAIEAKSQELNAAKAKHNQAKRLSERKLGSADDTKMAEAAVKAVEAAVDVEKAKLRGLETIDPKNGITQVEREVEAKKAQLQKAQYALDECTLKSPRAGTVLRVLISEGEMLGPNPRHPALQFAPAGPRVVRAEVEQEFAERVTLGQTARIHNDGNGEQRWTGKITRIGDWYTHRRSILQEPLQFNDVRTLECIITVDAGGPPLRIGQRVRVILESDSDI